MQMNWWLSPSLLSPLPPFETARALSQLCAVQCCQWEPIWNGQLIGIYKEIPVQINWWLSPLPMIPPSPIWNCQSTESTLHCPMSPMRAHSKQSTNKNISGKEISPLPPFHHNFTDLIFRCSGLPAHTADCPPNMWVYQYQYIVFTK